jgi:seryl-tRNA synthetase
LPAAFPEHQRVAHWDTATALGILDNERAVKISGAMFTMQRGAGATLARALCQYALDCNADAFEEIRPPSLVSTATLTATGQLPKFADDAYSMSKDDLWCIPTAEAHGALIVLSPRSGFCRQRHTRHAAQSRI